MYFCTVKCKKMIVNLDICLYNTTMSYKKTDICLSKDSRIAVAPLSKGDKRLIQEAKRKLGITKPAFYRTAILEKAKNVLGDTNDTSDN